MILKVALNSLFKSLRKVAFSIIKLFVLLFLFQLSGFAQDPSFSQFTSNNLYYNPAYVGSNEKIDILIHYRRFLTNMPSKFENIYFSIDYPFSKGKPIGMGGIGIMVFQNTEGDGCLKTSIIGIPLSTQISNYSQNFFIQFGIMPSIVFKSIEWEDFIFGNQLNPYSGYDPTIAPPLSNGLATSLPAFPDFSFGFFGKYIDYPTGQSNMTNILEFGIAFHHLPLNINQSFINGNAPLPFKFVGNIKYTFSLANNHREILIQPSAIFEMQGPMNTTMIGAKVFNNSLLFGVGFRKEQSKLLEFNSFTIEGGYSIFDSNKRLWIILSIDVPMKSKYPIANTSYEVSLNIKIPDLSRIICKPINGW